MRRLLGLLLLISASCYNPTIPSGSFACGPGGACPSGQSCMGGLCVGGAPPSDGAVDGPLDGTPDAPACSNPTVVPLRAIADTYIDTDMQTISFGGSGVVRAGVKTHALFIFNTSSIPSLTPARSIVSIVLRLYRADHAVECNTIAALSCATCNNPNPDALGLYYMRSDWTDSQATWLQANAQTQWKAAGATKFPEDRSARLGSAQKRNGGSEVFWDISDTASEFNGRRVLNGSLVAFEVAGPDSNTGDLSSFNMQTLESGACAGVGQGAALLEVKYCP